MIKRKDFLFLFDVTDGNPNGDPDAGNQPRIDPITGHGLVSDACTKRKIRNRVQIAKGEQDGYAIYVAEGAILNHTHEEAYQRLGLQVPVKPSKPKGKGKVKKDETPTLTREQVKQLREDARRVETEMCRRYFDVRTFGAVMATDIDAGEAKGPVQITFARSIDPIAPLEHSITRLAVTTETESIKQRGGNRTMGRKYTVPYALYLGRGFLNPHFAGLTGFSDDDEAVFWDAMRNMFEDDRSAARGFMSLRKLVIFTHECPLGNAPAHQLFDRVRVARKNPGKEATGYSDYDIEIDVDKLPAGVAVEIWPEELAKKTKPSEEGAEVDAVPDESLEEVLA